MFLFAPGRASADGAFSNVRMRPYPQGQCTDYVAERWLADFSDPVLFWNGAAGRHAKTFLQRAENAGRALGTAPRVGAIAYEPKSRWGHVSYVEEVFADGSFRVSESNFAGRRRMTTNRIVQPHEARGFIYPLEDRVMVADAVLLGPPAPPVEGNPQEGAVASANAYVAGPVASPLQQEFIPVAQLEVSPPVAQEEQPAPRGRTVACTLTAYYQPLRGQAKYVKSYAWDVRMNGDDTTASGTKVRQGIIAAPKSVPFGTNVEIEGLGTYTVEDRGGAIVQAGSHYRFDLWVGSGDVGREAAMKFGKKRNQTCRILEG